MLDQFILTIAVLSQFTGGDLSDAMRMAEQQYIVPTIQTVQEMEAQREEFEWQLEERIRTEFAAPKKIGTQTNAGIDASAAIIIDDNTQQVLWQKNPDDVLSFASITKLMTAMTWVDYQPAGGFSETYTLGPEDDTPGGKELNLSHGRQVSTNDLFNAGLVSSYNDLIMGLVHSSYLSEEEFVAAMNEKAELLGMESTEFAEPTGLSEHNKGTVHDVARMARYAFQDEDIEEATQQTEYAFRAVGDGTDRRAFTTNNLLYDTDLDIIAGKTGYTDEAGYCVVVKAREPNSGRDVIAVILGTPNEDARFVEAKKLIEWTFANYTWQQ